MGYSSQSLFLPSPINSSPYMCVLPVPSLLTQSDHAEFGTLFHVVFEPFNCLIYRVYANIYSILVFNISIFVFSIFY